MVRGTPHGGVWLALALVAGCAGCSAGGARDDAGPADTPKLAILISIDTLRADHLGFYGYPRPTSPNLDALAREAVVFEDAQSTAPWTLPAHASILTGRYPSRLGIAGVASQLPPEVPTLAELLRSAGWQTAAFVNSRFLSERHGFERGFSHFEYLPESYHQIGSAADLLERAANRIAEPRERPLFIFLHIYDVHSDYRARHVHQHDLVRPYDGDTAGLTAQLQAVRNTDALLEASDLAHLVDLYDAQIREVDANLGRFFERLRLLGEFQNAFIALVADHGDEFQEHGGVMHGRSHYREVLRVPFLVRDPAWPSPRRIASPVSTVDVVPTMLGALGISQPGTLDGRDLTPLALLGRPGEPGQEQPDAERILYAEAVQTAAQAELLWARQGDYALHLDVATGSHQLFDLRRDPGEQMDLAATLPERSVGLMASLSDFAAGARVHSERFDLTPDDRGALAALGYLTPTGAVGGASGPKTAGRLHSKTPAAVVNRN
jgi:arylsulfatase A-like enzyme